MSDTKGQHTNIKEDRSTAERKDAGKPPKAHAGASGPGTDNSQADTYRQGNEHHRRRGGPPEGK